MTKATQWTELYIMKHFGEVTGRVFFDKEKIFVARDGVSIGMLSPYRAKRKKVKELNV